MAIGGIGTTGYTVGYETRRMERNTAGKNFAEEIEKNVNVDNIAACNKTFELQGGGAILSTIHVQTGESIGIYYDEEAGGNHMVAKVKGTDGSEKEIKIDPDEVDPSNASYVEMLALSAHLKQQGKIDSPAGGIVAMTMAKRVQEANATLNVGSIVSCQQLLDEYDMRGTNHVIISPETLSKMESDPALKKSVLSKIEEFCSSESQKEIQALSPPVKSAGMIIYPDGSTLYWLEGYPNEIGNEKDKKIVNEMSISESFQKYSDTNYQATENNLESIMQIMATEYKRKSIS